VQSELSREQIESYREKGFLIVEDFLSASELARWREVTDDAVAKRLQLKNGWQNQGNPEDYYAKVFTQCVKLADTHEGMREIMFDERLGRLAGTLAGVKGIRIWHDQALIKPPYGNPTAWHLDCPYWSFSSRDAISIWVALDDATLANGCMWYLPRTHKAARFENVGIGQNLGDLFKVYPEWKAIDPKAAPVPAGTAVFHNGLTAHGAGANMTNRPRRAMTCAYMPEGSTFNGVKNVLPDEYFNKLKVGDVLDDPKINPLIWRED
jgi:phytanoyl-CoA hydroxylase